MHDLATLWTIRFARHLASSLPRGKILLLGFKAFCCKEFAARTCSVHQSFLVFPILCTHFLLSGPPACSGNLSRNIFICCSGIALHPLKHPCRTWTSAHWQGCCATEGCRSYIAASRATMGHLEFPSIMLPFCAWPPQEREREQSSLVCKRARSILLSLQRRQHPSHLKHPILISKCSFTSSVRQLDILLACFNLRLLVLHTLFPNLRAAFFNKGSGNLHRSCGSNTEWIQHTNKP